MMTKDRIIVFNLNGRGGMLHYSSQFVNALAKFHDVRVVLPSYSEDNLYANKNEIWRIKTDPNLKSFLFDTLNIFAHIGLIRKIWQYHPSIIHFIDNHPWYIFYSMIGRLFGTKIYVTQHDPFPHSGENKGLFYRVAIGVNTFLREICDTLIVHEASMKEKIIELYKIPERKIVSIPHGSYDFLEKNEGIKKEVATFLFFGRIVEYKGLDILLEAIRILKETYNNPFRLIIAGEGAITPYQEAIYAIGSSIELYNRYIPDNEVRDLFSRASFVVLPYRDATASGVIPLAYSFSLPVIASDVGVLVNYILDGKTGFLIESENPRKLKEKIELLLTNTGLAEELGKGGYEFQKENLSWESIVRKIYPSTFSQ